MSKNNKITVISLGGSLIIPTEGFKADFLLAFKKMIEAEIKIGRRFIIVCGGGATARNYQAVGRSLKLDNTALDWAGIYATHLNANLMRLLFGSTAHPVVVIDPSKKINWRTKVLLAGGWKPGRSTDYDAVKLAEIYGANQVINLSNVDYVYTSDPKKNPQAEKLAEVSWKEFRKIVGDKWNPGANLPFDPIASKLAEKLKLKVCFAKGDNLEELKNILNNKKFKGTIIF